MIRRAAAACLVSLAFAGAAAAETIVVNDCGSLYYYDTATPGTLSSTAPITGLGNSSACLVGIDFRPSTGALYGLVSEQGPTAHRLYLLPPAGGAATQVGAAIVPPFTAFFEYGLGFDPVADLIRVVTASNDNQRVDPDDATATADTDLVYAPGDPRFGTDSVVAGGSGPGPAFEIPAADTTRLALLALLLAAGGLFLARSRLG